MGVKTVDCPEIKVVYLAVSFRKAGGVFLIRFTCVEVSVTAEGHYVAW